MKLEYQSGFWNTFSTEAKSGALPQTQNSPQKAPYGLYAEQLSGTSFLMPRHENLRSWLYRIRPSVIHGQFKLHENPKVKTAPFHHSPTTPQQLRWDPVSLPKKATHFLDGLYTMLANGDAQMQAGCGVHIYSINQSMDKIFFYNSDGEMLFVPEQGTLLLKTECGQLEVEPEEIAVIPRGIKFQVALKGKSARGYVCENYGLPLRLPNLGVIGANGLAYARHFLSPFASFEDREGDFELVTKFHGHLWSTKIKHSPLDVVAWTGNYAPYKYDLRLYNTINTVSFDHPDPSIFTVLTSPSDTPGTSNLDFAIFPPRWMVAENTFRPPYYHRNIMSEYMGLIKGQYDAKEEGFVPGGGSLHNCMSAHGPDADAFSKASNAKLEPNRYKDTLAFMFESRYVFHPTEFAMKSGLLQRNYTDCWQSLKKNFKK